MSNFYSDLMMRVSSQGVYILTVDSCGGLGIACIHPLDANCTHAGWPVYNWTMIGFELSAGPVQIYLLHRWGDKERLFITCHVWNIARTLNIQFVVFGSYTRITQITVCFLLFVFNISQYLVIGIYENVSQVENTYLRPGRAFIKWYRNLFRESLHRHQRTGKPQWNCNC